MKKIVGMAKKVYVAMMMLILVSVPQVAFAGGVGSSKIITGTERLINDLTTGLLILAPISGGLFILYFAIRRGAADEMDQKMWNKRIMVAITSTVIASLASVIIKVVVAYYK